MNRFINVLFLLYCGFCTLIAISLVVDYYLPKSTVKSVVSNGVSERVRSRSSATTHYYVSFDNKTISVSALAYNSFDIGDTLIIHKTQVLDRVFAFESESNSQSRYYPYSSMYNGFPLIPILICIPILNFFIDPKSKFGQITKTFSLIVPIVIMLFELM